MKLSELELLKLSDENYKIYKISKFKNGYSILEYYLHYDLVKDEEKIPICSTCFYSIKKKNYQNILLQMDSIMENQIN